MEKKISEIEKKARLWDIQQEIARLQQEGQKLAQELQNGN